MTRAEADPATVGIWVNSLGIVGTFYDSARSQAHIATMIAKRIQLIIRDAGICSRRHAEDLIREGRVTLNGRIVDHLGQTADPERDHIKVDGKLLRVTEAERLFYLFNKPRNVVCTWSDPHGRPCLQDVLKSVKGKLFAVGRLDFDAEGLMILTNDGNAAHRLSHPSSHIPRTYVVKVAGSPDVQALGKIRKGMAIGEGERLGEVAWSVVQPQERTTWVKMTLYEGKKNEIKRIFLRIGHPVRKIRRIAFGPIALGPLPVGSVRPCTAAETERIAALIASGPEGPSASREPRRTIRSVPRGKNPPWPRNRKGRK